MFYGFSLLCVVCYLQYLLYIIMNAGINSFCKERTSCQVKLAFYFQVQVLLGFHVAFSIYSSQNAMHRKVYNIFHFFSYEEAEVARDGVICPR